MPRPIRLTALVFALVTLPSSVAAQQSIGDVLSFLLTNRSIPTGDFVQDARAAAATRDTISTFLLVELASLPVASTVSAFTYRLDPNLGMPVRSSDSFGPFLVERSLTSGRLRGSFGFSYHAASFDTIDDRNLKDGTLVATAGRLQGETQPFDVETLSLDLVMKTMTILGNFGVTDRLDIGAALPIVTLSLSGRRVDTYRGTALEQAIGFASASGPGDFLIRGKYNFLRRGGDGLAIGGEARLPTGSEENLLGAGETSIKPAMIGSLERERVAVHGNLGYAIGGLSDGLVYGGAITVLGAPRLTLVGEIAGRRLSSASRLTEITEPHPTLVGVETIRLTSVERTTNRMVGLIGVKWNIAGTLLFSANVLRTLTSAGLDARWVPTVALDYSFER